MQQKRKVIFILFVFISFIYLISLLFRSVSIRLRINEEKEWFKQYNSMQNKPGYSTISICPIVVFERRADKQWVKF